MKIALVFLLLVVGAQLPSCSSLTSSDSDKIIGYVEDKYTAPERQGGPSVPWIVVDRVDYRVPWNFWRAVRVGDIVKRENGIWSIVKKYVP